MEIGMNLRLRFHITVQAADRENGGSEVQRWFGIRRKECARLDRVFIDVHVNVEGLFNVSDRPADIQQGAIGMGSFDIQSVGLGKSNHGLVVLLAGAKGSGKLLGGQKVTKVGV